MGIHTNGSNPSPNEDVKRDHPLQAIIFADSYKNTFRPITLEIPKVLLPLANIPMIEYTIELLAGSGIEEILLFCTSHAEKIEKYLNEESIAAKTISSIQCITSTTCLSAGDALRELDRLQLIRSDPFILVTGDIISNLNLKKLIIEHKEKRKLNPSCIMTILFKKSQQNTPSRALTTNLVLAMDNNTKQILMYDDKNKNKYITFPTILFKENHKAVSFHKDLVDCHIDICSPDVLVQFSDNFDYQDLRNDFISNEVQNYELGHQIFAKIINKYDYAACVHDPRTYDAITRDMIHRWIHPIVPDNNLFNSNGNFNEYACSRNYVYKNLKDVKLERSCELIRDIIIGHSTSIGKKVKVNKSIIGNNCKIGNGVTITGSHIWDNVVIEDNVSILDTIICNYAHIKKNAIINKGSIISYHVTIDEGCVIPAFSKITTVKDEGAFELKTNNLTSWDSNIVGANGKGRIWTLDDDEISLDEDESEDESSDMPNNINILSKKEEINKKRFILLKKTLIARRENDYEMYDDSCISESSDEEDEIGRDSNISEDLLCPIDQLDIECHGKKSEKVDERKQQFVQVIYDLVMQSNQEKNETENIFLEIKSYKFAQNRTFTDCLEGIIPALLDLLNKKKSTMEEQSLMVTISSFKAILDKWSNIIKKCIMDMTDESIILKTIEDYILADKNRKTIFIPMFPYILQCFYDIEIVSEETILSWSKMKNPDSHKEEKLLIEHPKMIEFLDWLQASDDEESDSSEAS